MRISNVIAKQIKVVLDANDWRYQRRTFTRMKCLVDEIDEIFDERVRREWRLLRESGGRVEETDG